MESDIYICIYRARVLLGHTVVCMRNKIHIYMYMCVC